MSETSLRYTVVVGENSHYMDESEHYEHGRFATFEEAEAACRAIVERSLAEHYRDGIGAAELVRLYSTFGEDPFVRSTEATRTFSAWTWARQRCAELCGGELAPAP